MPEITLTVRFTVDGQPVEFLPSHRFHVDSSLAFRRSWPTGAPTPAPTIPSITSSIVGVTADQAFGIGLGGLAPLFTLGASGLFLMADGSFTGDRLTVGIQNLGATQAQVAGITGG